MKITMLGLSITSSWGNGHATTYRGLVRELARRGHEVLFLERDVPWYAENRDLTSVPYARIALYGSLQQLVDEHARDVRDADLVIVGSYVPEGAEVGEWVVRTAQGLPAFYDIDTPVTIERLRQGDLEYLSRKLVPEYGLYLSFTGGPVLEEIERRFGSPCARPLYCSADPELYAPDGDAKLKWDLGYMGTYSRDRQPALDELLLLPAQARRDLRMIVAGPEYPEEIEWPENVERRDHLAPAEHRRFYASQRFTLNLTRAAMVRAGWSPSVRLFEAGACGAAILSDAWPGLDELFADRSEILLVRRAGDVLRCLLEIPEAERVEIGRRARRRVLEGHTAAHRAQELEQYAAEALRERRIPRP